MKKFAYGVCVYKIEKDDVKILLCKSVSSFAKWGCLKGVKTNEETPIECAKREFEEESGIVIDILDFEKFFSQVNTTKDIGVWLVNANNIDNLDKYFVDDKLLDNYLSWENSKVKFFSINKLPKIRAKQERLIKDIVAYLKILVS